MKRILLLIVLMTYIATMSLFAQTGYRMVVEKYDGTTASFLSSDIKQIYFQEVENEQLDAFAVHLLTGIDCDFESGSMGNWNYWGGNAAITSPGYNSNFCVVMVTESNVESSGLAGQILYRFSEPLETGKKYRIQFYAKANKENTQICFRYQNPPDYNHQLVHPFTISTDWTLCRYDFTLPDDSYDVTEITIDFSKEVASCYIDNVRFGILKDGQGGGDTPNPQSSGEFQGTKRVFGDNQLYTSSCDEKTYTYHYDANGFVTQIDKEKPDNSKTYTITYGDKIVINSSSGTQWTATTESHGFIGTLDYSSSNGNVKRAVFTYNDDEQLTCVDYGDGDVYRLAYSDGNITSVTNDGKTISFIYETDSQNRILNVGNVMEFDNIFGIDLDDFNMLYYIGGLGKATKCLPLSRTKSGSTIACTWTTDDTGRATQALFNNYTLKWNWDN